MRCEICGSKMMYLGLDEGNPSVAVFYCERCGVKEVKYIGESYGEKD